MGRLNLWPIQVFFMSASVEFREVRQLKGLVILKVGYRSQL